MVSFALLRFLYAAGGDTQEFSAGKISSTVEFAPLDAFGAIGAFTYQRNSLPGPITAAAAVVVGSFVYLLGGAPELRDVCVADPAFDSGTDGTTVFNSVQRAVVLDPANVRPNLTIWFPRLG